MLLYPILGDIPAAQAAALGMFGGVPGGVDPLMPLMEENVAAAIGADSPENTIGTEDAEQVYSNCANTCCTGAFIQECMAGVIMSADIRELIFTAEQVASRGRSASLPVCNSGLEFNIPVVLSHLLSATHQHFSQLGR